MCSSDLVEILEDYNARYEQDFTLATHGKFKKDIAARLAHKKPYERIERNPEKQIDLLIVVDQMLTGFDSKWVNTLYMDKVLKYENIIQAFSRTNRLFGPDKPFGTIRYYRFPNTMERNINSAVALYSGNKPLGLFAEHLDYNLEKMNQIFGDISRLFTVAGISDRKDSLYIFVISSASSKLKSGKIVGSLRASIVFPDPGLPIIIILCPPLAATSKARLAFFWPFTSEKSSSYIP